MIQKKLQNDALKLAAIDKIHLVEILIESLDKPDAETMEKWIVESEKRYEAYKKGKVNSIPFNDVIDKLKTNAR